MSNPYIIPALISASAVLLSAAIGFTGVILTLRSQRPKIDADNRLALAEQTSEIKQHLKGGSE